MGTVIRAHDSWARDLSWRGGVERIEKRDEWGSVRQRPRPTSERVEAQREDLRIVPDNLWKRVAARRAEVEGKTVRFESGRISGRPPQHGVNNLLAGLATCAVCGGGLVVETSSRKIGRKSEYVCFRHRTSVCPNALRMSVETVNEAVLQAIEEHVFTPEAIEQVIALSERDEVRDEQAVLARERSDIEKRITRLVVAIEDGADAASINAKLRELEKRIKEIDVEMKALRPLPRLAPAVVETRLAEWRRNLSDFVNLTMNARFRNGAILSGGLDTGRTTSDRCFVVDSPQERRFCHIVAPFAAQTQFTLLGAYPLPWSMQVSGNWQNVSVLPYTAGTTLPVTTGWSWATYVATNAQIAPSLGRNLAAGAAGTALIELVEPFSVLADRLNQVDLRLAKMLRFRNARVQLQFDVYNALNANSILSLNTRYGSAWLRPIQILDGRIIKFGGQLMF